MVLLFSRVANVTVPAACLCSFASLSMQNVGLFKPKVSQPGQTGPVDQHPTTDPSARALKFEFEFLKVLKGFCSKRASVSSFTPSACSPGSNRGNGGETLRET